MLGYTPYDGPRYWTPDAGQARREVPQVAASIAIITHVHDSAQTRNLLTSEATTPADNISISQNFFVAGADASEQVPTT